jgi:hypothetical protein
MTEKLKWTVPRDPCQCWQESTSMGSLSQKGVHMTKYELIGVVVGFGVLALAAFTMNAILNALDKGECGCKK